LFGFSFDTAISRDKRESLLWNNVRAQVFLELADMELDVFSLPLEVVICKTVRQFVPVL
jgi:hypothetical protein